MKYYVHTFGCQMNHADSERFASVVEGMNYEPTNDWQQADLIVFNTCSVRQKAEDRVIGMGPQIKKLKQQNQDLKVVLTGCMARRTWRGVAKTGSPIQMTQQSREQELKSHLPWVDVVIETKDFGKLPDRLGQFTDSIDEEPEHYLSFRPKRQQRFHAFVPISTGCDHFCTFCIVPFARGGEVCRTAESIIVEVFDLIADGFKDITLLGQTVNRWVNPKFDAEIKGGKIANTKIPELNSKPASEVMLQKWQEFFNSPKSVDEGVSSRIHTMDRFVPRDFLQLIQVLDQIPGRWWTNWVSSHPNYMTDQLIDFVGESVRLGLKSGFTTGHQRPNIHFAVQSGSNKILKRMNRRYTREEFLERIKVMRERIPDVGISTDVIVGFPDETINDVEETASLMEEASFDIAYISEFSPRKGTAAGLIEDNVPHSTKEQWKTYLNDEVLAKTSRANNQKLVGTVQFVLIEKREKGNLQGRTATNRHIRITGKHNPLMVGEFARIKVTGCTDWALEGEVYEEIPDPKRYRL